MLKSQLRITSNFIYGLVCGLFLAMIVSYIIFNFLVFPTIYTDKFSGRVFEQEVYCGLSQAEVKRLLGEPLEIRQVTKGEKDFETWFYSTQKYGSSNYRLFYVEFLNQLVWNKNAVLYID